VERLALLEQQAEDKQIDLFYADESGISEQGYSPYGWQFKDEKVSIPVGHGQQLNIFGLLSRDNKLLFKTTTQTINTAFLIVFFDEFVLKIQKPTVIILDGNAQLMLKFISQKPLKSDVSIGKQEVFSLSIYHLIRLI
jgi:hypothetical protein